MTAAVLDRLPPERDLPTIPYRMRAYDGPTTTADLTEESERLAEARAAIQGPYQRRPGDVRTLLWRARALDIPVGVAIDHVYITMQGKAGLSAQLIAALLRRAGITWTTTTTVHQVSHTYSEATWYATRTGKIIRRKVRRGTVTYSLTDARLAGIADSRHWRRWPAACMWARAMAKAGRELFPDVCMGFSYTPEELVTGADSTDTPVVVDAAVIDVIEQARSVDATPELIKTEIMPRVRKLLKKPASDNATLAQVLADIWQYKTEQAAAAEADAATAAVTTPGHAEATITGGTWATAPVGEGTLPCGCPAVALITDVHEEGCTGVLPD